MEAGQRSADTIASWPIGGEAKGYEKGKHHGKISRPENRERHTHATYTRFLAPTGRQDEGRGQRGV